jgi:nucleotide-binding universal stress UspA family protein
VVEPLISKMVVEVGGAVEEQMHAIATRITTVSGVPASAELLLGKAVPEICEYIEDEGIDLVVIATHGWGGIQRAWLGSMTDALVRTASVPVLAVRPRGHAPMPTPVPATEPGAGEEPGGAVTAAPYTAAGQALLEGEIAVRPLLPLDGSTLAESAIEPLLDLVGPDATYTLLRVAQLSVPPDPMVASWTPELWRDQLALLEGEARNDLDELAKQLAPRVREVKTVVLSSLSAAPAILAYAEEHQVDLIAISTRGHGGIRRLALGSTADKVLRGSEAPVLIVRPKARGAT